MANNEGRQWMLPDCHRRAVEREKGEEYNCQRRFVKDAEGSLTTSCRMICGVVGCAHLIMM